MVTALLGSAAGDEHLARALSGKLHRRAAIDSELVAVGDRRFATVIDDQYLVRKIEDEVALIGLTLEPPAHRLELKSELVAERAVQTEVGVIGRVKHLDEAAQHREHGRSLAA